LALFVYTTLWHENILVLNSRIANCYRQCKFAAYRDEFSKYVIHSVTRDGTEIK